MNREWLQYTAYVKYFEGETQIWKLLQCHRGPNKSSTRLSMLAGVGYKNYPYFYPIQDHMSHTILKYYFLSLAAWRHTICLPFFASSTLHFLFNRSTWKPQTDSHYETILNDFFMNIYLTGVTFTFYWTCSFIIYIFS